MKRPLPWPDALTIQRCSRLAIFLGTLFFFTIVHAQSSWPDRNITRSASGQFIITGDAGFSPLFHEPGVIANTNLLQLDPATLAVTAERIKQVLEHKLGLHFDPTWQGKIFLALHPAHSVDDEITIVAQPFDKNWNYQIQLPDVLSKRRFSRALTGALLLEFASRNAGPNGHVAEVPAWLVDGLAQGLLADDTPNLLLSAPGKTVDGFVQVRTDKTQRGLDPLADARRVLKNFPALTFEQMSWPDDAQSNGNDGGAYFASAQVFVNALLNLKNGKTDLCALLENLSSCYNWQTAFQKAFLADFPSQLDLEKWWAVQVVSFLASDPGPAWTPEVSREKLDAILNVPVAVRASSNSLPAHAEVTLQAAIHDFDRRQQTSILQLKLRDLEITELRLAPQLAGLADGYRRALAGYLGAQSDLPYLLPKHRGQVSSRRFSMKETLKKLDELDTRRRAVEARIKPDVLKP